MGLSYVHYTFSLLGRMLCSGEHGGFEENKRDHPISAPDAPDMMEKIWAFGNS